MKLNYILDGHQPVVVEDIHEWGRWFETADRRVALTEVGEAEVSTVFLGVDHRFIGEGPPILFETMIFSGDDTYADYQWRYTTWDEAAAHHELVVEALREGGDLDAL